MIQQQQHSGKGDNIQLTVSNRSKIPSTLTEIINLISSSPNNEKLKQEELEELNKYKIPEKITYNNLSVYKVVIDEYKKYYGTINSIYGVFDVEGSDKKEKVLRRIKNKYLIHRGWYEKKEEISIKEVARKYSDKIFENLFEELKKEIVQSLNIDKHRTVEDVDAGLYIVLVDAFIKCNILEEPN